MNSFLSPGDQKLVGRRELIRGLGASAMLTAFPSLRLLAAPASAPSDSLPMQFYKSLTEEQHSKICLPVNDPKRSFVSNWWYVHPGQRLHTFYTEDQQDLVQQIFDSLHHEEHREKMKWQVQKDLMGKIKNTPSVGFFGTPDDEAFEFIYTGHHVTRRCNAHTDKGMGFGGEPIFYGNFAKSFNETKDHEGNPYWYQGLIFNEFVSALDGGSSCCCHWSVAVRASVIPSTAGSRRRSWWVANRAASDPTWSSKNAKPIFPGLPAPI